MIYFGFSNWFCLSASSSTDELAMDRSVCSLVCVCQSAPAVGSSGCFKVYGRWWICDFGAPGAGHLAALIMETQLAVFMVSMEGGMAAWMGRWYTRYSMSCCQCCMWKLDDRVRCVSSHRQYNTHPPQVGVFHQRRRINVLLIIRELLRSSLQAKDNEQNRERRSIHKQMNR